MSMTILAPLQSKAAREALGLSQSKVARETGINRSTLALFEVNKYLLDDRDLHSLRDFYESHGHTFEEVAKPAQVATVASPQPAPVATPLAAYEARDEDDYAPVVDGFVIPSGFDQDEVEAVLDQIHANDAAIAEIAAQPVKRHWFTDDIISEPSDKALTLMARNYVLIRQLQGRVMAEAANDDGEPETYGDVLHRRITD
jgi:transcriptional regulator with XRE-family HTH domain